MSKNVTHQSFNEQMERKQKMMEKTRKAAELVWNIKNSRNSPMAEEEKERKLEQYLRWTEAKKKKHRQMFFTLFRRSLRQQKARHWWRYPTTAPRHCAIQIMLCWLLLCFSGIISFRFLVEDDQNWWLFDVNAHNWAKITAVFVHSVAIVGLWMKVAFLIALSAVLYTLFSIVVFSYMFYHLFWMATCQIDPKIPYQFPLLLPLLGLTSKSLWETFAMFQWDAKLRNKGTVKEGNDCFGTDSNNLRPRKTKMHNYHLSLIERAKNKNPEKIQKHFVLLPGRDAKKHVIVHMPKSEIELRRRRQQQKQ